MPQPCSETVAVSVYISRMLLRGPLIEASRDDHEAFEAALRPLIQSGYQLAFGMLHSRADAEDAVQDAAMRAWRKRHLLREGSDIKPWFLAVVANQCRSTRRSRWWSVLKSPELPRTVEFPDDVVLDAASLRAAIRQLPYKQRLALVLHFYLDLSFEEVAAISGVSTAAVKSRIYRAASELAAHAAVREVFG